MSYTFNNLPEIYDQIKQAKTKLIYVAGASASGKSFFGEKLKAYLESQGNNVLSVSSDMYYTDDSSTKYLLYGTYDHPNLISYDELTKHIHQYFETGVMPLPEYSFVEKRRINTGSTSEHYDYLIIEGLYTISQLPNTHNPFKIFVYADPEELIFRRLIRDQERTQEPLYRSIAITSKVFPMWNLYGISQQKKSDLVVYNDYEILEVKGTSSIHHQLPAGTKSSDLGTLEKRLYVTEFTYDDSNPGNGKILIAECYKNKVGLLDHVSITKSKQESDTEVKHITMDLYEPGILTGLHTLLQLAGLNYEGNTKLILSTYQDKDKTIKVIKQKGKYYEIK